MTYRTASLAISGILLVCSFTCLLVSVSTNWWVSIRVNKSDLNLGADSKYELAYLNRNRGVFLECFSENLITVRELLKNSDLADDSRECIRTNFGETDVVYSQPNKTRLDLLIAQAVFLVFALFLGLCGFIVFAYSLFINDEYTRNKWSTAVKWAGVLLYLAAFSNALGMAFFHGAEYLELQKIEAKGDEVSYLYYFRLAQPTVLINATVRYYSWSYTLSWLAVFLDVIAATVLFLSGSCCGPKKPEKMMFDGSTMHSSRSMGHRNRAYEFADGTLPPIVYNGPPVQVVNDGSYYDHFKDRHFNPYNGRGGPQMEFSPSYNFEQGGWNWN